MPDILIETEDFTRLAESRNLFRAVPSGQRFNVGGQPPEETLRPPSIDIGEPGREPDSETLNLTGGEEKTANFWYDTGIPASIRFWIEWYLTQEDADARENMYTEYEIETIFYPARPIPNINDTEQIGTVDIRAPAEIGNIVLIGKILIYQP